MENELVTVASFNTAPEMGLVRSKLESEGIECFVQDEYTSQTYVNSIVGGMKIQVYPEDAERAKQIVEEMGVYNEPENVSSRMIAFDRVSRRLPIIGGLNLVVRFFAFLVLLAVVLVAFYVLLVL